MAISSIYHVLKMESSKSINCTVLKSLKVPERGLGVVFKVITPGSILKECYEVTISAFPIYACKGFRYVCSYALENSSKKWILYKHLYFILQTRRLYTPDDAFIHCPGWTLNEVLQLLGRMNAE